MSIVTRTKNFIHTQERIVLMESLIERLNHLRVQGDTRSFFFRQNSIIWRRWRRFREMLNVILPTGNPSIIIQQKEDRMKTSSVIFIVAD